MVLTVLLYGRYILTATRPVPSFYVSGLVCIRGEFHKCSDVLIYSHAEFLREFYEYVELTMYYVYYVYGFDVSS